MVGVFLGLLKKIPWQLWLLSGVLFTFWLYGVWQYNRGQENVQIKWDESTKLGQAIVEDLKLRANAVVTVIEHKVTTETVYIRGNADVIIKEVPIYIPAGTPDLPGGFRLLHDAASSAGLPDSTQLANAASVGVEETTITVVDNYATCLHWKAQLLGWQEWHKEQSLVWQTAQHK